MVLDTWHNKMGMAFWFLRTGILAWYLRYPRGQHGTIGEAFSVFDSLRFIIRLRNVLPIFV